MAWSCSACTYRNKNDGAKQCFTCNSVREKHTNTIDLTGAESSKNDTKPPAKRGSASLGRPSGAPTGQNDSQGIKKAKTTSTSNDDKPTDKKQTSLGFALGDTYAAIRNESYEVRSKRCQEVMENVFKIDQLRKQQPKAVECALKGQSQVIVMATGGGKSLCYQLPAVVLGGVTVCVSPLIALMRDQVDSLLRLGVKAACICSANTEKENSEVLDRLLGRKLKATKKPSETNLQPVNIVYVTPESLQTQRFQNILKELNAKKRLALFAIDEAHCASR